MFCFSCCALLAALCLLCFACTLLAALCLLWCACCALLAARCCAWLARLECWTREVDVTAPVGVKRADGILEGLAEASSQVGVKGSPSTLPGNRQWAVIQHAIYTIGNRKASNSPYLKTYKHITLYIYHDICVHICTYTSTVAFRDFCCQPRYPSLRSLVT